jgi:phosphatidylserine decarboxylase
MCLLYAFYRDPDIDHNIFNKNHIYSPANGKILKIVETYKYYLITIFLNLHNVHIQYIPYDGVIKNIKHIPGKYYLASSDCADNNEKMITTIKTDIGYIYVIQIAGKLVRRIVNFNNINDTLKVGDKLGIIKFGSRVDIQIPKHKVKLLVKQNDIIHGGVTKIAKII